MRQEKEKTYRDPPAPEVPLFPNFAYKMKKRTNLAVINTTEVEVEQNVAAVKEVTKDYPVSKQQGGSTTPSQSTASRAKSAQPTSKAPEGSNAPTKARHPAPTSNSQPTNQTLRKNNSAKGSCRVCQKQGHWARGCKERTEILCYRCEHPGVIVATCPNCCNSATGAGGRNNKQNQSPSNSSELASVGSPIQSEKNLVKTCFISPPCQTAAVGNVDNRLYVNIEIHGRVFPALLDSGAIASLLGPKPAELIKSRIMPCSTYMVMANGQTDKIVGEVELMFAIDGEEITSRIRVSNSLNYDIILGMDLMERLQMRINFEDRTWYTKRYRLSFLPQKTRTLVPFMP